MKSISVGSAVKLFAALPILTTVAAAATTVPMASLMVNDGFHGFTHILKRSASAAIFKPKQQFKMELIHTNDMHSRFEQTNRLSGVCTPWEAQRQMCYGGFARVATIIKQAREAARKGETPPVLVLNAGDNFQGSIYYTLFKAEIVTKFINLLQFDALSLGNHEFDDGPLELEPYLRNITRPVVAANVDTSQCGFLQHINLRPSVILDVGGQKIGIIGYLTQETDILHTCKVEITDEITAVKKEAKRLSQQGIQIIIALGHSGFKVDQQIAFQIPEIDLVVGAHSHTFLYNENEHAPPDPIDVPKERYPKIVTQRSGKKVPVVQAFAYTKYIGRLSLTFDANGEMTSIAGNPVLLDKNIPEDPVVLEELKMWKDKVLYYTNKIEGFAPVLLDNANCRYRECNIGNVIADAHVHFRAKSSAGSKVKGWTDAPIALVNAGNIRNSIDTTTKNGEVSLRDIIEVVPFSDKIYLVKLKGDVLVEVLEHSVSQYDSTLADNKGAFLQVSGLKVEYNIDKPPGKRVEKVLVLCSECDVPKHYPLKVDEIYSVLVPSYMGQGGDGFTMIANKGEITSFDEHSQTAVKTYFNDMSPITTNVGHRILIKNSAMPLQDYTFVFISPADPNMMLSQIQAVNGGQCC